MAPVNGGFLPPDWIPVFLVGLVGNYLRGASPPPLFWWSFSKSFMCWFCRLLCSCGKGWIWIRLMGTTLLLLLPHEGSASSWAPCPCMKNQDYQKLPHEHLLTLRYQNGDNDIWLLNMCTLTFLALFKALADLIHSTSSLWIVMAIYIQIFLSEWHSPLLDIHYYHFHQILPTNLI